METLAIGMALIGILYIVLLFVILKMMSVRSKQEEIKPKLIVEKRNKASTKISLELLQPDKVSAAA